MLKKIALATVITTTLLMTGCVTSQSTIQQQNLELLQNKNWSLTHIGATEYKVDPTAHNSPSLQFDATTQRLSGADGCNRIMGSYVVKKHEINLGQLASTKMMCQNTVELSSKFNEALNKVAGYQVYGQTLKLLDRHGNPVLQFKSNTN